MNKKKPIILAAVILMAVVTAISASTFAWFTAQDSVVNRVETAKLTDGDVTIMETFDPDDRLMPGVDINKDVGAINTGDSPALVRISFSESLLKLAVKTPGEYQVRRGKHFNHTDMSAYLNTHIPELVDISKFEANGWSVYNPDPTKETDLPWVKTGQTSAFINDDSRQDLKQLTGTAAIDSFDDIAGVTAGNVVFVYKETSKTPLKYAWQAFSPLGTTPQTYQRVELRPEFFNLIRVPANDPAHPEYAADRSKDELRLKVTMGDPASKLYSGPAAGDNRYINYISLELATLKTAPYKADWRVRTSQTALGAIAAGQPIRATFPKAKGNGAVAPESNWNYYLKTRTTDINGFPITNPKEKGYMAAVTDSYNSYLELVFWSEFVTTDVADLALDTNGVPVGAGKWFYNELDGFFYYLGVLEPGMATNLLLDAIHLSEKARSDYSHVMFELTVHMDAIQATGLAVTSTDGGGWGSDYYGSTPAGTIPTVLSDCLRAICPKADQ